MESHLLQMRGLKRERCQCWIMETLSHLLQMRGLKLNFRVEYYGWLMSHLLQMRGLKHYRKVCVYRFRQVASFTDAWIETKSRNGSSINLSYVASFTDAWIETTWRNRKIPTFQSHLLQMRGLKHFYWFRVRASIGRIFYRCVD